MDSTVNRTLLVERLLALRERMLSFAKQKQRYLDAASDQNRESLRNLLHYIAMRQSDLHEVQLQLAAIGLSSLGRSEGFVLDSLNRVLEYLGEKSVETMLGWQEAEQLLHRNTRDLLGEHPTDRHVLVMVTAPLPDEATVAWMENCLGAGMNILRINCAHGTIADWEKLIQNLQQATQRSGLACRIAMDIAGPKLRTGPVHGAAELLRLRVKRDVFGRVQQPALVRIGAHRALEDGLTFSDDFIAHCREGDTLRFRDSRGKKRALRLACDAAGLFGSCDEGAYVLKETGFTLRRGSKTIATDFCGPLPIVHAALELRPGDKLILFAGEGEGFPATTYGPDALAVHARIGCTMPEAVAAIRPGERVIFDDGRITAVCEIAGESEVTLQVTNASASGSKLRAEKGINLPDTKLPVSALTPKDREDLLFVLQYADIVSASFIHSAQDVAELQEIIRKSNRHPGLLLKIETKSGFENLPAILLQALADHPVGVMIARGDLAVEAGFERLAEMQEEILWFCEAAHMPVVWATQVLENLAQTGQPSRAEITDAAMSVRAECVMLNKGPYIGEALRTLVSILKKMEKHQYKKRNLYRPLSLHLPE